MPRECHICQGRETLDSCLTYQLSNAPLPEKIPLCEYHLAACEGALYEVRKIQTPPVIVNVSGVSAFGAEARLILP
jgi:hypothetical protein